MSETAWGKWSVAVICLLVPVLVGCPPVDSQDEALQPGPSPATTAGGFIAGGGVAVTSPASEIPEFAPLPGESDLPVAEQTQAAGASMQAGKQPAAGSVRLVPIPLELPAPAFRGTPVPLNEPNVEKPAGKPRPPFLAPEGTVNLALGKPVSCSDLAPLGGELDMVTDGNKEASDFAYLELHPGTQWVQIDLGARATIYAIVVWHNHAQARVYRDVVVQISDDPDFLLAHTVYNNDYDNSSGLGVGGDLGYVETSEGRLIDCRGLVGRYVRLYSRGNHMDEKNHYAEVEVYGIPVE